MATDNLTRILHGVGEMIGIGALEPDENDSCLIALPNGINLQVELDPTREKVLIGADIGEVPPGAYRERVFEAALKDNVTPSREFGIIAYSEDIDHLVIWRYLPATSSAAAVFEAVQLVLRKATLWFDAIRTGNIPKLDMLPEEEGGDMFGIKL